MEQQWIEKLQQDLETIEREYSEATTPQDRHRLRGEFQKIRVSCEELLGSWIELHDHIMRLLELHPDLEDEEEVISEDFWLSEGVVRAFRQGQGYYNLKLFLEAKKHFQQVVVEEPEFLLGRLYLALSHFQENQLDEAQRQFQLIVEMADHERFVAFANHMLGCVAVRRKDDQKAIRYFRKALSLIEDEGDTWFNLGACYYRLGEYHEAIPCFYHSLLHDQDDWESMFYLSSCYQKLKQWQNVTLWRLAAYVKTESPEVMESIAHDYEDMGDTRRALGWYQKLQQRDPSRLSAYQGIAWSMWSLGHREEAITWLKKGLSLAPENPDLLFTYIWILLKKGSAEEADRVLEKIPVELTRQAKWLVVRSELLIQRGAFGQAIALAKKIINTGRSKELQGLGHYQQGRVLLEMSQPSKALDHFRQASRLCPNWRDPLFYEGVCHAIEGRFDVTRSLWKKISL